MARSRKVATNLSVRADLVREARALDLNLSEIFEAAVTEAVRRKQREAWLRANRESIEAYNDRIARDGVFSDAWRKF
jgi:antitoxin CcdA